MKRKKKKQKGIDVMAEAMKAVIDASRVLNDTKQPKK